MDYMPVVDPTTHVASRVPLQVRDPLTPTTASTPPMMPSPYWGEEVIWDSQSVAHSFAMDRQARVWIAARVRPAETPAFCRAGSSHPSAQAFPIERSNRQIQLWDPETKEITTVDTCFGTHHLNLADDDTLWFTGSGPVVAWFDTKVLDETGDEALAQADGCRSSTPTATADETSMSSQASRSILPRTHGSSAASTAWPRVRSTDRFGGRHWGCPGDSSGSCRVTTR